MSEWRKVKIGDIATESKELELNPDVNKKIRVRLNVNGVEKRPLIAEKEGATKYYKRKSGQFIYGRQNFHKGAFGIIPKSLDGYGSSADLPAFDIDKSCLSEWLVYWFKTENRYLQLLKHARGIGSQRVSTADFYKTEILLPNITTQQEIINKIKSVEQKTNLFDSEISNQQTYLTKLRQAILQEAIEGKLTADWRVNNPVIKGDINTDASALLATIKAEKQKLITAGKIKKEKPLAPINADDVPFALPDGWVWVRLGEIVNNIADVDHKMPNEVTAGIPYISPRDFFCRNKINFESAKKISQSDYEELSKKIKPEKNDIIFPRYGTIGVCRYIDFERQFLVSYSCVTIKTNKVFTSPKYIFFFCISPFSKIEIARYTVKTTQPNVGLNSIKQFLFPLPPLAEQQAIVARVDRLLDSVNVLEQQVQERKTYAEQLMQAVLKEAFSQ